jgi:cobalt-zinc-cadmium efflux system membrane fusion protein
MNTEESVNSRDPGLEASTSTAASTSPITRQLVVITVVAAVLVGLVSVTKAHAKAGSGDGPSANNALNPNQILITKAAEEAVELRTARVTIEPGKHAILTNGVVHYSPYGTINVSPRLVGRVRAVYVKVGDHVSLGQPLALMVSSDAANAVDASLDADQQLKLTAVALATARRQFVMGTPEVTAAESALIQAHESAQFNKRMLELTREQNSIGGFTDKPLTDAQSTARQVDTQLSQDLKDLALDQTQFDRVSKLFGYGVTAKADVETANDTLEKQKDAVANDREQSRIAHVTIAREEKAYKSRLYANQAVRQAETSYEQAVVQERGAATALSMVKASLLHDLKQAEHDYQAANADDKAAHTVLSTYDNPTPEGEVIIHSPATGVITARNINPGQIVDQTGSTPWQMMTIVDSDQVYVDAQIYEKDMIGVRIGERVTATSEALPKNFLAVGAIDYISPGLDPTTHALSVRAQLDNRRGLLKDGMFVSTSVDVSPASPFPSTPIVPLTAVVHDGDNDYVFIARGRGKYDRRQVTLGDQRGESNVSITKGLTGDETIVTHGALYLGAGGTQAD